MTEKACSQSESLTIQAHKVDGIQITANVRKPKRQISVSFKTKARRSPLPHEERNSAVRQEKQPISRASSRISKRPAWNTGGGSATERIAKKPISGAKPFMQPIEAPHLARKTEVSPIEDLRQSPIPTLNLTDESHISITTGSTSPNIAQPSLPSEISRSNGDPEPCPGLLELAPAAESLDAETQSVPIASDTAHMPSPPFPDGPRSVIGASSVEEMFSGLSSLEREYLSEGSPQKSRHTVTMAPDGDFNATVLDFRRSTRSEPGPLPTCSEVSESSGSAEGHPAQDVPGSWASANLPIPSLPTNPASVLAIRHEHLRADPPLPQRHYARPASRAETSATHSADYRHSIDRRDRIRPSTATSVVSTDDRSEYSFKDDPTSRRVDRILDFLKGVEEDDSKSAAELHAKQSDFESILGGSNSTSGLKSQMGNSAAVFDGVKAKIIGQQMELDEKTRTLSMLKKELKKLKDNMREQTLESRKELKSKLAMQRKEYETIIKRHLTFIDKLLAEKEELTKKF
ncbi:uncharacterized protein EV422DRAFT_7596 [Fimicolochytrium jonesii]|uniref:uncharacterized protein n=1 Tax=Fimicolochytrium jonesii TaxID=1396493 RepID=UPI0022FE62B6|nr:uncharacterized protein EV422DRAFT_7596 [Fimicolochytrium jonesii]KAI8826716.1 hypothetical protein EV422DRAFT_7596 [Fimicolochytrium jonesii]